MDAAASQRIQHAKSVLKKLEELKFELDTPVTGWESQRLEVSKSIAVLKKAIETEKKNQERTEYWQEAWHFFQGTARRVLAKFVSLVHTIVSRNH
jgi:hypothetical protein